MPNELVNKGHTAGWRDQGKDSLLQTVTFRRGSYSADDIGYRSRRLAGRDLI
jgi:hypothetical protein